MKLGYLFFIHCIFFIVSGCKKNTTSTTNTHKSSIPVKTDFADGFTIDKNADFTKIQVTKPWPNAIDTLTYYLVSKNKSIPEHLKDKKIIRTPINRIIVTSTTHISLLEALNMEHTLVGFPDTKYVSAQKIRKRINTGKTKDVGSLTSLNSELILDLKPELIISFSSNGSNKAFDLFERSGIAVLMNGSWLESHPLGRTEWIKVFGCLYEKENEATALFETIKTNYLNVMASTEKIANKPTVLSGNMYKDVWYVPGGNSYAAKLIHDAGGAYLWESDTNNGSLPLNFEAVYEKAAHAKVWIGGGKFKSTEALGRFEEKYKLFDAFKAQQVFSKDLKKGETGGTLYYEQGSFRADWILNDLIKIFHPNLAPNYEFHFYQKLK